MSDFDFDDAKSTIAVPDLALPVAPTRSFSLLVESGPDRGASFDVDGAAPQAAIAGQSPVCTVRLVDGTVSRRHASFEVVGDLLRVRDLGSKNGTFLGTVRVVEAFAQEGDAVALGATLLRVRVRRDPTPKLPLDERFDHVLGVSSEMRRLYPLLRRLAETTMPVLIEGETGTGKEVLAAAIHAQGPRAHGPFVVLDCTSVAPNLIESELFGHEKGAFTGATSRRAGVFEQARGGTLFIDELGDLPLDLQPKLLRALESGQVRRVGSDVWVKTDARVVAATRRDLERRVADGQFRDDLFHRMAIGRVALPPLRDRKGDVPLLVAHFCGLLGVQPSTIPRSLLAEWCAHPWPGNVRELRNEVTRRVLLGDVTGAPIEEAPPSPTEAPADASGGAAGGELDRIVAALLPYDEARQRALAVFQRHYTDAMVRASGNNVQRAAEAAGIALRYFQILRSRTRA